MRIALPSDDQTSIASHFGRARGFLLFDVDGGAAKPSGYRKMSAEPKENCACSADERPSRHEAVLDALNGCDVVIARGMGAHMYDDLLACGLEIFLTDTPDARTAVNQFLTQTLPENASLGCADT